MNCVQLIGRITRDPEVRYGATSGVAVARFSIAIDRGKDKNGNERGVDYPNIVCLGKIAEHVEKWCFKGQLVGIIGKLETGSYEKDGKKVFFTEINASRVEFLSSRTQTEQTPQEPVQQLTPPEQMGFAQLTDEDIPY